MSGRLLEGALGLAARGIPVIPLRPRSKVPRHANWPNLGMLDPDSIRIEWGLNPDSNVGVLCGADAFGGRGLTVIDVDLPDGTDTLRRLEDEHGPFPGATAAVETPSGGAHYYLTGHTASWNPGPGLEVRSVGRQCAAPPSIHPNGGQYGWFQRMPLAPLPAWLTAASGRDEQPRTATFTPSGLRDPVLEVPPPVYFQELCGLTPDRDGFVCCPLPGHGEVEASCKVYPTADRGWFCYGESCRHGGDIVTLAALLAGVDTPVCGYRFIQTLDYLRGRFS
jgi:Bifunctional DNA primase/polymerase, N-terminal